MNMADKKPATATKKVKKTTEEAGAKKQQAKFPSAFGSHASMINKELTAELQKQQPESSVLEDENGAYITETARLDTHMADPNRYANEAHRKALLSKFNLKVTEAKKE
jgi:hypothetical protein